MFIVRHFAHSVLCVPVCCCLGNPHGKGLVGSDPIRGSLVILHSETFLYIKEFRLLQFFDGDLEHFDDG